MSTRTFRITVRGVFHGLGADQRAAPPADAAAHDVLRGAFTPEGHLNLSQAPLGRRQRREAAQKYA